MKTINVLIVSRGQPTKTFKTQGIFEFDQAKLLASSNYKVIFSFIDMRSILRIRKFGLVHYKYNENLIICGYNFPFGKYFPKIRLILSTIFFSRLYRYITNKYGHPNIIHSHFTEVAAIVSKSLSSDIPHIMTEHSSKVNRLEIDRTTEMFANIAYSSVDRIITVSQSLSSNIKRRFNKDSVIIPNVYDSNVFKFNPDASKVQIDSKNLTCVGNLVDVKNIDLLIRSFHLLIQNRKYHDFKLFIIGSGELHKVFEKLIEDLQLRNKVFLLGKLNREKIKEMYYNSLLFILLSKSETFGLSYVEALACGLPIISTRNGGTNDFINNRNGILLELDKDLSYYSNSIADFIDEVVDFDREKISIEIHKKFSGDSLIKNLRNLYETILKEK